MKRRLGATVALDAPRRGAFQRCFARSRVGTWVAKARGQHGPSSPPSLERFPHLSPRRLLRGLRFGRRPGRHVLVFGHVRQRRQERSSHDDPRRRKEHVVLVLVLVQQQWLEQAERRDRRRVQQRRRLRQLVLLLRRSREQPRHDAGQRAQLRERLVYGCGRGLPRRVHQLRLLMGRLVRRKRAAVTAES